MRLKVLDVERNGRSLDSSSIPAGDIIATFRTCVREVMFLDETSSLPDPVVEDGAAYSRLVEVVCGLHSPMAGETQVQGQFKSFLDGLTAREHQWVRRLGQQVLADAGAIRESCLRGLGSRTYGSAVRRLASDSAVVGIIGAGALAREVREYVTDTHTVDLWTRDRLQQLASTPTSQEPTPDAATLVIAAPVDTRVIEAVAAKYPALVRIIDLRAADEVTPLPAGVPALTLADIFAESQATGGVAARVAAARSAAAQCGRRFELREELHPFGWEDLCA